MTTNPQSSKEQFKQEMKVDVELPDEYSRGYFVGKQAAHEFRCMLSGCQYGIEGVDKEPRPSCIFCGKGRPKGSQYGIGIMNALNNK